ncbi:hypothetical protein BDB01DRAFT_786202 [Pilobolus umbonatus]|nr:hypothetical protein BDB01DRAFT_786202 [Pilobolus umbonatus]
MAALTLTSFLSSFSFYIFILFFFSMSHQHRHTIHPMDRTRRDSSMHIDAEDEEAGTILMALAHHADRIINSSHNHNDMNTMKYDEKPKRSNSMSIKNLLEPKPSLPITKQPWTTQETIGYSDNKKGFQAIHPYQKIERKRKSFRRPSQVKLPSNSIHKPKYRKNTTHIHISYRILVHQSSVIRPPYLSNHQNGYLPTHWRPSYPHHIV